MSEMPRHAPDEIICREFVELVTEYWEGALPEHRAELVEEHLIMCDWCLTYVQQLDLTVRALPATAEPELVPSRVQTSLAEVFREWAARE